MRSLLGLQFKNKIKDPVHEVIMERSSRRVWETVEMETIYRGQDSEFLWELNLHEEDVESQLETDILELTTD
jgi:hypothetical protein